MIFFSGWLKSEAMIGHFQSVIAHRHKTNFAVSIKLFLIRRMVRYLFDGNPNPMKSTRNKGRSRAVVHLALAAVICGGLSGCGQNKGGSFYVGMELYKTCAPCHGEAGEGSYVLLTPGLAGLPAWYVEKTIQAFRSGIRGTHADDAAEMRMRPFARSVASDEDVNRLAEYIAGLPRTQQLPRVQGDIDSGRRLYATCRACHGESGEGNETLGAPPLSGIPDWYMLSELKQFKRGIRGSKPDDHSGALMQRSIGILTDEEDMRDVVAYIATLQ